MVWNIYYIAHLLIQKKGYLEDSRVLWVIYFCYFIYELVEIDDYVNNLCTYIIYIFCIFVEYGYSLGYN